MNGPARLSVRASARPSHLYHYAPCHHIIMKFSGVITIHKSDVHAKGQGQRSKVKVTEVKTQLNRFRTVSSVWKQIWWWNDTYSLMLLRKGALLFFKVIRPISRSHGAKNRQIWPRLGEIPDCNSSLNSPKATKCCTNLEVAQKRCHIVFEDHQSNFEVTRLKKSSNLTQIGRFWTVAPVWIHQLVRNDAKSLKYHRKGALLFLKVILQLSRSHGSRNRRIWPKLVISGL